MYNEPNCPYLNTANEDARLTQRGRLQATSVGAKLVHTKPVPQVVMVSPLFRTLQTCTIALSTIPHLQVPVVAVEAIRERTGLHVCDKRSNKSKLESSFAPVDFSNIEPGEDSNFLPHRETVEQTAKRGKAFLLSLRSRPETSIALFSHSSFLFNTLSRSCEAPDPTGMFIKYPVSQMPISLFLFFLFFSFFLNSILVFPPLLLYFE